jgi:hypothetical protein
VTDPSYGQIPEELREYRPKLLQPLFNNIPEQFRAINAWVGFRLKWIPPSGKKPGRWTKEPVNIRTGALAKTDDPSTWCDFHTAVENYQRMGCDGIGLCRTDDLIFVDLDGVLDCAGALRPFAWAQKIFDVVRKHCYVERSVTDTGLHAIGRGHLPQGRRQWDDPHLEHTGFAIYDKHRFFTMSGHVFGNNGEISDMTAELRRIHARLFPPQPPKVKAKPKAAAWLADDDIIARALKAKDGGKFNRLWNGQWEHEYSSQSEADLALCMKLAFWTNRDAGLIDALFRRSGLVRQKWERDDYREATIARAIEQTTETWTPKPRSVVSPAAAVIDLNRFEPSLDLLNSLIVWQGRIQFTSVKRRGPMLIATTTSKLEVIWPSTAELASFSKTQAIIADTANILIPTPPHRQIRAQWEPAIALLLQLAAKDGLSLEPALKEEVRDLVRLMWRAARQPVAKNSGEFIEFMRAVQQTRRNPAGAVPPCVFAAEKQAWVHVPSFRAWLSLPSLTNRMYPLAEVRNGLLLLGFVYCENLRRGHEGDTETTCLWRGPLTVLGPPRKEPEK